MVASIFDIAENASISTSRSAAGGLAAMAELRVRIGMEAWVVDERGNWPAYLEGLETSAANGERLRWIGPGPVGDRLTLRFAHGLSLFEWETEAFATGELSFETTVPKAVSRCRARSDQRLVPPVGTTVQLPNGGRRAVLEISGTGLCFALNILMDEVNEGEVVPLLLKSPGMPALSLRVEVRHLSEVGEDGPLTAGGPVDLDHPAAHAVWSQLVESTSRSAV
jgi:hypothetical protein